MDALIGKKVGMTQVFSKEGNCIPVTVVQVEKCVPLLRRTQDKDGYDAVLVAYGTRKSKHTNKPDQGFYDKMKAEPAKLLAEFRGQEVADDELGKPLKVDIFSEGDSVSVVGTSKGKGFAGVFKRWGFGGAPASHGHHEIYRGGGSIGMHTWPGRVFKGKKMPGHMGSEKVFVKNLKVVRVDTENNVLLIKGAVPGAPGGIVRIVKS
ncbi:MAG TPA: 50S ribosomal protein L3 [Nitrospinaceae bacterium]|jgi:large subunit ribosomal protein L3|nr:50S ribosomal protein L3 [Nitrospinaceae bacterium]MDP7108593.1 50S ribosomal protein L3 [Nitrospinaceae bacterium]HJL72648.1 50S ribosomal protein L3 [Nitrospinaceae bacterium]HJO00614.1 50S ribosomal protein L3 [Nitrospinaceae bacterium]